MLELKNLSKSFSAHTRLALNNINLTVDQGDYCVIIGNNGSGKSTLLKLISGEHTITSGEIFLNQQNISCLPIHLRAPYIASVSQDINSGTIGDLTVTENINLGTIRAKPASYKFCKKLPNEINASIKHLGFTELNIVDKKMSDLSGGQRQVIACLMATNPIPDLLLLDEHTSALDAKTRAKIMFSTNQLIRDKRITTLMVTHNIHDAVTYGNRLLVMSYGQIIYDFRGSAKAHLTEQQILNILNDADENI
ncbi:MAG: ATP-binding cassette domain-containing protein [Rickettsiaceae bacterium]|nr:ATP-binding cassette domain-containing protein [Rickettsiaceae bacterium]